MYKISMLLIMLLMIFITACQPVMPEETFSCHLPESKLFNENYNGRTSNATNPQAWQAGTGSTLGRIDSVLLNLDENGGRLGKSVANWLIDAEPNYVLHDDLVYGAGFAVYQETETSPDIFGIGARVLREQDDVFIGLNLIHEADHWEGRDLNSGGSDNSDALCKEMRAEALATRVYSEFRYMGYSHPAFEENMLILARNDWQWQSSEWAIHVRTLWPGLSYTEVE